MAAAGFAALVVALSGCHVGEAEPGAYVAIAREDGGEGGLAALLEGRLAEEDGCLWVTREPGDRYLPIWPHGARPYGVPDGPSVVVEVDGRKFTVGSTVALGGGETTDLDLIEPQLEAPIPSDCAGGPFWSISSVAPGP